MSAGNVLSSTIEAWGESGARTAPLQNFFLDRYADAYRAELEHFVELLDGRADPLIGYRDGILALRIAEAAMESHRTSEVVAIG